MNIETDDYCCRCGDKIHGPFMTITILLHRKPFSLPFHLDCYFAISEEFYKTYDNTRKLVIAGMERPVG